MHARIDKIAATGRSGVLVAAASGGGGNTSGGGWGLGFGGLFDSSASNASSAAPRETTRERGASVDNDKGVFAASARAAEARLALHEERLQRLFEALRANTNAAAETYLSQECANVELRERFAERDGAVEATLAELAAAVGAAAARTARGGSGGCGRG